MGPRHELFYDTETVLRLVDDEVRAMTDEGRADGAPLSVVQGASLAALASTLQRANVEIQAVIDGLRDNPAAGAPETRDSTAQRLAYAGSVVTDVQERLLTIARLFDPPAAVVQRAAGAVPG